MRKSFEQSAETVKIVNMFRDLKYDEPISFAQASLTIGFPIKSTTPAYQSAKLIAERDHGVYVATIRKFGFSRGTGKDMISSGAGLFSSIRKKSTRIASRMLLAINENLNEKDHLVAVEMYSRANIIASTTSAAVTSSNRKRPDIGDQASVFDFATALSNIKGAGKS